MSLPLVDYIVMAYIGVTIYVSYGLYRYGLYSYGPYIYGLHSYGRTMPEPHFGVRVLTGGVRHWCPSVICNPDTMHPWFLVH